MRSPLRLARATEPHLRAHERQSRQDLTVFERQAAAAFAAAAVASAADGKCSSRAACAKRWMRSAERSSGCCGAGGRKDGVRVLTQGGRAGGRKDGRTDCYQTAPHLRRDSARPTYASAPGRGSPCCHICAGIGLTPRMAQPWRGRSRMAHLRSGCRPRLLAMDARRCRSRTDASALPRLGALRPAPNLQSRG
jgi:hypothetical protein